MSEAKNLSVADLIQNLFGLRARLHTLVEARRDLKRQSRELKERLEETRRIVGTDRERIPEGVDPKKWEEFLAEWDSFQKEYSNFQF